MSQNAKQKQISRTAPTIPFKIHEPVDDVSPDDPIGVQPDPGPGQQPTSAPER